MDSPTKANLKKIAPYLGDGQIFYANNHPNCEVAVISTGSYGLNHILGIGGWPVGRIIEIYGNESTGKSTLTMKAIAECQKTGGNVVFLDLEGTFNNDWAEKNGVDLTKLILAKPDSGEQAFTIINGLIKAQLVNLIIVDSVVAMVPEAELKADLEDQSMGLHARLMGRGIRLIQASLLTNPNVCVIFTNQIRSKVGNVYGPTFTTPGGYALKFAASVRVELKRVEAIKDGADILGHYIKATVIKNKLAPPLKSELIPLSYQVGFDYDGEIIEHAIKFGIISKNGSWYSYQEKNLAQGLKNLKEKLKSTPELFQEISNQVISHQN